MVITTIAMKRVAIPGATLLETHQRSTLLVNDKCLKFLLAPNPLELYVINKETSNN